MIAPPPPPLYGIVREEFGPKGTSKSIFIIKPDAGCQGKGIFLTKQVCDVAARANHC